MGKDVESPTAADVYADKPNAMHLRAMNMLYEDLKERGALLVVPSSALDSMNLGSGWRRCGSAWERRG